VSLYRTWRPLTFTGLVGQDAVVRTLRSALAGGKLAHAYLFSGPRGSGKTSAAKILARCIDCVLGPTPDPDNTCEFCRAILAGTALDVVEVDAASNRGIEEIRALRESVKFAPASMRMKVFIIDEAHMLTREGANAFLKTLEEPPPHAVFILATTAPEALPPTILSRCQRYPFRRIPIAVMIARMREIADAENISIGDDALGAIAYRADGGLRDALTMLEQVASYAQGPIDATTVEAAFGATGRQYARGLVEAVLAGDAATALRIVDEASDAGADMTGLIRGAVAEYRNLLVARIDPQLLARDLSASDAGTVVALAGSVAQPKVVRGLRLLGDALAAGRGSGNPRLELETAVLRLVVQAEDPSLEALATRVALLETGTSATASAAPAARGIPASANAAAAPVRERAVAVTPSPPAADATVPAPSVQQVRSLWDQIRLRAEERYKPMRGMLAQATVDSLEGNALVIGVVDALQESLMRERLPILERAVGDVLGLPLRIVFRTRGGAAPRTPRAASSERAPNPARTATVERTTSDASEITNNGEADLLAYARQKLGGTERR
jgi:DNA polymerase-3 subunit gamma/tau